MVADFDYQTQTFLLNKGSKQHFGRTAKSADIDISCAVPRLIASALVGSLVPRQYLLITSKTATIQYKPVTSLAGNNNALAHYKQSHGFNQISHALSDVRGLYGCSCNLFDVISVYSLNLLSYKWPGTRLLRGRLLILQYFFSVGGVWST